MSTEVRDRTCQPTSMPAGDSDLAVRDGQGVDDLACTRYAVEDRPTVFFCSLAAVTRTLDVIRHWIF